MTDPMVRRAAAAQATLDTWSKRPFRLGFADCVRMTAAHLRLLGHHVKLPPSGSYRTAKSALKALREAGHDTLHAALSTIGLEEIAPASAIVGDVMMVDGGDEFGALGICVGNGRVLLYHEEIATGAVTAQPVIMIAAWRVNPI